MVEIFTVTNAAAYTSPLEPSSIMVLFSGRGLEKLAAEGIIAPVSFSYTEDERTTFIKDYTHFIAELNQTHKDKFLWWATNLSSKNTYSCAFPEYMQELMEIRAAIQNAPGRPLLLVNPSAAIHDSLKKLCLAHGHQLVWPQAKRQTFLKRHNTAALHLRRLLANALRFYVRSVWARLALRSYARQNLSAEKEFYVIKTFSFPSSWDSQGNYTDPYFARLPQWLSKDRHVLVLTYQSPKEYRKFISRIPAQKDVTMLPVDFFLKGSDILRAVIRVLKFYLPVAQDLYFRDIEIADTLRFELASSVNGIQFFQLLHYDALRHAAKRVHMTHFLLTFENNPWERMCMWALRHYSPLTKVIGYQHSVVPEAALNMFVHPQEKHIVPLPDRILTAGDIPRDILKHYGDYPIPVISSCAWRYEYLSAIKPAPRPKSGGRVLVVLDGVVQTRQLLKFVLQQLGGHKRYQLRIRCHPALPWEFFAKCGFDVAPLANVQISREILQKDVLWSDVIVYWQTTVVLEAMAMGRPAVNFVTRDILNFDPLFKTRALKYTVAEGGNLAQTIAEVEAMDEKTYQEQLAQARDYIRRYFRDVTPEAAEFFKFD